MVVHDHNPHAVHAAGIRLDGGGVVRALGEARDTCDIRVGCILTSGKPCDALVWVGLPSSVIVDIIVKMMPSYIE